MTHIHRPLHRRFGQSGSMGFILNSLLGSKMGLTTAGTGGYDRLWPTPVFPLHVCGLNKLSQNKKGPEFPPALEVFVY